MSKNVVIDGQTYNGVTSIKVKEAITNNDVVFVFTGDATATASDIATGKTAYVNGVLVTGSMPTDGYDGLVDGSLVTFTMPAGRTRVHRYLFYNSTVLTYANLQGATVIEDYAFYGCTNAEIVLPNTLTTINSYAFYNAGKASAPMELNCPTNTCSVGTYAFRQAKISKVKGKYTSLGSYAFYGCSLLEEIDIECTSLGTYALCVDSGENIPLTKLHLVINGSVGERACSSLYKVSDLSISGNITSLANSSFSTLGSKRDNPQSNHLTMDFSSSTFTSIGQYAFGNGTQNWGMKYMEITIPSTCTSVGSYAFQYIQNSNIFFKSATPPVIQSTTFSNMSNTVLWIPYNSVNAYRVASNWSASSVSSAIKGYAKENTFTTGQTLPTINEEGYGLTWYSDKACTTQVTTVADATQKVYCVVGTTLLAYKLTKNTNVNCTVTITDGVTSYSVGDMILIGTVLTITATPDQPNYTVYNNMFTVNGVTIQSGDTVTVSSDIAVLALYWDGVNPPLSPTLSDNSWDMIKLACENNIIPSSWAEGDTKTDGNGVAWMLVDKTQGRYAKANGGYTNAVFGRVNAYAGAIHWNTGTWDTTYGNTTLNSALQQGGTLYSLEDQTLMGLIDSSKIIIQCGNSRDSGTTPATVGLFTAAYSELGFTGSYGYATTNETKCEGVVKGSFTYFADNDANKRKKSVSGTTYIKWWTRSHYTTNWTNVQVLATGAHNGITKDGATCYALSFFAW